MRGSFLFDYLVKGSNSGDEYTVDKVHFICDYLLVCVGRAVPLEIACLLLLVEASLSLGGHG